MKAEIKEIQTSLTITMVCPMCRRKYPLSFSLSRESSRAMTVQCTLCYEFFPIKLRPQIALDIDYVTLTIGPDPVPLPNQPVPPTQS